MVYEKNTHAMTLVDPYVVCEKNTHAMTLGVVHEKNRHEVKLGVEDEYKKSLENVANICLNLAKRPPETFHEAIQSLWFLFVILHMESNASSFSPGRMDQYTYPYYQKDTACHYYTKTKELLSGLESDISEPKRFYDI